MKRVADPIVAFALLAVLPVGGHACVRTFQVTAQAPTRWQDVDHLFRAYADSDRNVGASFVYMKDGRVVQRDDYGYADRASGKKMDEQSIYHWGSITKTLTAISIMQLRDRGKLSLDDHITKYVPELHAMHDPYNMMDSITIRMLLSHTAGFQNPTWTYDSGEPWEPFEPTTWNQLVAMMPYQQLHFRPGARYSYSNPGFIYLARVIEQLTGDPWESYVQKNIFAPLNLDHSYFRTTPYYLAAQRPHNYYVRKDKSGATQVVDNGTDFDPGITTPNGGWNAPFTDLVKYLTFLTNSPGPSSANYDVVLKRSSFAEMWTPVAPMSQGYEAAPNEWMGLSFFIVKRGDTMVYGHTGSQAGFHTFIFFNPKNASAVIAGFNTTNEVSPASAAQRRFLDGALDLLK